MYSFCPAGSFFFSVTVTLKSVYHHFLQPTYVRYFHLYLTLTFDTFTELIMDLESYNIPLPQETNAFKRKGKDTKGEGYILIGLE